MTHAERLAAVLHALRFGPLSISAVASASKIPLTSAWKAVADLLLAGKVVFHGHALNPSYKGGAPLKLYALANDEPRPKPLITYARQEKNAKRTEWKPQRARPFAGSGVIAGRITIGRGAKWGSGLA